MFLRCLELGLDSNTRESSWRHGKSLARTRRRCSLRRRHEYTRHVELPLAFSRVLHLLPDPRFLPLSAATSWALCLSTSSSNSLPSTPPPGQRRPPPPPSSSVGGWFQPSRSETPVPGVPGGVSAFLGSSSFCWGWPSSLPLRVPDPLPVGHRDVSPEDDLDLVGGVRGGGGKSSLKAFVGCGGGKLLWFGFNGTVTDGLSEAWCGAPRYCSWTLACPLARG